MKTKIIPFDLETAKKIQTGEIEGRIVTQNNEPARIVCFDKIGYRNIATLVRTKDIDGKEVEKFMTYNNDGDGAHNTEDKLFIELMNDKNMSASYFKHTITYDSGMGNNETSVIYEIDYNSTDTQVFKKENGDMVVLCGTDEYIECIKNILCGKEVDELTCKVKTEHVRFIDLPEKVK